MKTAILTVCLCFMALGITACGKKGELEDPNKDKFTNLSQNLTTGN